MLDAPSLLVDPMWPLPRRMGLDPADRFDDAARARSASPSRVFAPSCPFGPEKALGALPDEGRPSLRGGASRNGAEPAKAMDTRSDGRSHGDDFGLLREDFNNYIITLGFKK